MGVAIDTVAGFVTNNSALTNVTPAGGDSLTVRNFRSPAAARLEALIMKGTGVRTMAVRSPSFHDNVNGIRMISGQQPTQFALPQEVGQPLQANDTLVVQATSAASAGDSTIVALQHYYDDLPGAAARLHSWDDIKNNIKSIKPVVIAAAASATVGTWNDTLITASESLLHANTDYAVLGYTVDVACAVVALRGADTSNYRVGGPGSVLQDTTSDYFVELGLRHGTPHIPVFNAANAGSTVVSVLDNVASTAVNVQLICAELATPLPN